MRGANLGQILTDNFRPFSVGRGRRVNWFTVAAFGLLPLGVGIALTKLAGPIDSKQNDVYIAVFAVVGAVLTALLAVVQTVVGATDTKTAYDAGARVKESKRIIRLEVLRELYANIAFTVLFLVLGSIPLILLEIDTLPCWLRHGSSGAVYVVCVLVFVTFLHIVSGVYLVLDVQAQDASDELDRLREEADRKRTD